MALPPSSPRLPSPPPPAEIQIGPKSPSFGPNAMRQGQLMEQTAIDANAKRRIHPGTKSHDMAAGPPLVSLQELDSAFQLQEHLAALHYFHTASNTFPMTRETARILATPPPSIDKTLWLYELCRFLVGQCNSLIVGFLFDSPPCSAATCPEMRASEWQFLCAVHETPKSCCAIDYCCHTLDWAANVVTNPKIFPSRFVVDAHDKNLALKNLVNVFRRLHRIFAHAWFQHRGVFWSVEGQTGLYVLFKTVCDVYDLLPAENYKLPPEAEGLESIDAADNAVERKTILQPQQPQPQQHQLNPGISASRQSVNRNALDISAADENLASLSRTNTRRHIKSSPSTGSAVTTVPEADEDDSATEMSHRLRRMHLSAAATAAEDVEMELASIPVIVEHMPLEHPPPIRPTTVVPVEYPEGGMASFRPFEDHATDLYAHDFMPEPEPELAQSEVTLDSRVYEGHAPEPYHPAPEMEVHVQELEPEPEPEAESGQGAVAQEAESEPEPVPARKDEEEAVLDEAQPDSKTEEEDAPGLKTVQGDAASREESASDAGSVSVPTPPASDGEPGVEDDDDDLEIESSSPVAAVAEPEEEEGGKKTKAAAETEPEEADEDGDAKKAKKGDAAEEEPVTTI
ncbi:Mob1/phocein [Schizothecium vesticola]|uniref:Mob1/phocein n=1 Tax=Schizothecium vesticola TaxID=314040 RepID=A0AA40K9S6_9PEZI|nr:Mob1/phocein [Schizothecium vesticola]